MIIDQLSGLSGYEPLHPRFPAAFAFLRELLANHPADGRYVMPGCDVPDAVYVNLSSNDLLPRQEATAEAHRRYIDLQVVLTGTEVMYVPAVRPAEAGPYRADADCVLYAPVRLEDCTRLLIPAGSFAVFFAGELHAPCAPAGPAPATARKAVMKILA